MRALILESMKLPPLAYRIPRKLDHDLANVVLARYRLTPAGRRLLLGLAKGTGKALLQTASLLVGMGLIERLHWRQNMYRITVFGRRVAENL